MTTTATTRSRPGRRPAPVWISIVNTCTAAVVLWFYALPGGSTYLVVLDALVLVVSAATVWALVSNRPRLAQTLLGATVLLALPAVAIGSPSWRSSPWRSWSAPPEHADQARAANPLRAGGSQPPQVVARR